MDTGNDGPQEPSTRLARRLGLGDAVMIGLGSMIGAGIFSALGPAARAAGAGLLIGLTIAAVVALANAMSTAQLAALYPRSGGSYVYGRKRLGHPWGFLAGWCFVVGKTASCAAMAATFGAYVAPEHGRLLAAGAALAVTALNLAGVQRTATATRVIVVGVLAVLGLVVVLGVSGADSAAALGPIGSSGIRGVLESAGLLFFAFAGYARIATLGEEVRDPARTIPRAVPLALGITLVVYAAVAVVALFTVGPERLAASGAPLVTVVDAAGADWAGPVVRAGAAVGSLGVLLALLAGVGRTTFAMAAGSDLPRPLAAVHPRTKVPHRAELAIGATVTVLVLVVDLRSAIGFSSFAVLLYYAVANASAWTLLPDERRWPRAVPIVGFAGCVLLAATLPTESVVGGVVVVLLGAVGWFARRAVSTP